MFGGSSGAVIFCSASSTRRTWLLPPQRRTWDQCVCVCVAAGLWACVWQRSDPAGQVNLNYGKISLIVLTV